jgi:uncharacterized protein involved in outer membrane biogenesis
LREDLLEITSLDGQALGGSLHGTGSMTVSGTPAYTAQLEFTGADVRALAALFGERWGSGGTAAISARLRLSGTDAHTLAQSAVGTVSWDWSDGGWQQLADTSFAAFRSWTVDGAVNDGQITITRGLIANAAAAQPVSGTITVDRKLDLELGTPPSAVVTGTFADPELSGAKPDE